MFCELLWEAKLNKENGPNVVFVKTSEVYLLVELRFHVWIRIYVYTKVCKHKRLKLFTVDAV